jgi:uridine kinase
MQITEYILNCFRKSKSQRLVIGITGRAGAGKTTLAQKISQELTLAQIDNVAYSGDWHFILDSKGRKEWLSEKWRAGMDAYLNAMNQFSWWDFKSIFKDITALKNGQGVVIEDAYDRVTGTKTAKIEIDPMERGVIIYENCILGTPEALSSLDMVVLVNTPEHVCLERVLRKDSLRRSVADVATRYLMTTYSENIFLQVLREQFSGRTITCDSDGGFAPFPQINEITHIPVPVHARKPQKLNRGTIFCDLDGTLIKHVPVPSYSGDDIELLEGSVEKLKEFREQGYLIVLTTSRSQTNIFGVLERLRSMGVECDQVICDLPIGPRHLINDSKGSEVRAVAHALVRDAGLKDVKIQ